MAKLSKRKIQQVISSFFMMLCFCSLPVRAQYGGGTGEPNDPYLIYTAEQMNQIGSNPKDWNKHFKLMADIDLNAYTNDQFNIIGGNPPFTGVFDGNRHVISNFSYTSPDKDCIGLFGYVYRVSGKQAEIKNLGLIDPNINAGTGDYVGSLIGWLDAGTITGCYVEGGNVVGYENVGGLVGAHGHRIPGFDPSVIPPYPPYTISYCYSTSRVKGTIYVGGMVGFNIGRITNCYSMGSVIGNDIVGGLVGQDGDWGLDPTWGGKMLNCYSTSHVVGQSNTGGLVGLNVWGMIINNCFWDIQTSGWTISDGGTGKITDEMQTPSTFLEAGWDFVDEIENGTEDIWWILEAQSYPSLWWQYGKAFSPYPQDSTVDVPQSLILSWLPGGSGLYHDVYFGEDVEAVINATTESPDIFRGRQEPEITTYDLGNLNLDKIYYWRIDEINDADPNSPWKGNVWSFTTANFIIVDDFESYDAADNQIWYSWNDGLGYGPPGAWDVGNYTGSAIGDETTPSYTEETIVHGGMQSMPYWYDNDKVGYAKYSEAEKWLDYPRDWTKDGVSELSLWFHGRSDFIGSFVEEPVGVFTINSSGTDIGGGHDQFHFAYKSLSGPGSIVARIGSIKNTHEWAKAGVMIRQSLDDISKNAFVYVTPSNGIAFQTRAEWRQTSVATNRTGITAPLWLKLERDEAGNFTASYSVNGTAWQTVQNAVPMNISMSSDVYIGLALTSHNSDAISQAVFSNVIITGTISEQWEHQDIGTVNNDSEPMYVAVSNSAGPTAVVVHPDAASTQITTWTEWVIPLQTFADQGVDLTDVDQIAIGFGTRGNMNLPGGQGKMYFDDIRLYQSRSVASNDSEDNVPLNP